MVTSTQMEELAIHPSELHASRREENVQAVCLETSQVRRATAGSRVNLHEHACDAKWVVCHAAVTVALDRESAQDGVVAQSFTRKELAGKQRAPTQGPVQTAGVTTRW